jgi:hypothetical protein
MLAKEVMNELLRLDMLTNLFTLKACTLGNDCKPLGDQSITETLYMIFNWVIKCLVVEKIYIKEGMYGGNKPKSTSGNIYN